MFCTFFKVLFLSQMLCSIFLFRYRRETVYLWGLWKKFHEPAQHETTPAHSHGWEALPLRCLRPAFPFLKHAQSPQGKVLPGQQPHGTLPHPSWRGPRIDWFGHSQSDTKPALDSSQWSVWSPPGQVSLVFLWTSYRKCPSSTTVFLWKG